MSAPDETGGPSSPPHGPPQLPPVLIAVIISVLTVLFVFNVVADVLSEAYNGYPTTALLGLLVGSGIGIDRYIRRG